MYPKPCRTRHVPALSHRVPSLIPASSPPHPRHIPATSPRVAYTRYPHIPYTHIPSYTHPRASDIPDTCIYHIRIYPPIHIPARRIYRYPHIPYTHIPSYTHPRASHTPIPAYTIYLYTLLYTSPRVAYTECPRAAPQAALRVGPAGCTRLAHLAQVPQHAWTPPPPIPPSPPPTSIPPPPPSTRRTAACLVGARVHIPVSEYNPSQCAEYVYISQSVSITPVSVPNTCTYPSQCTECVYISQSVYRIRVHIPVSVPNTSCA
jgi:hypothetical protein